MKNETEFWLPKPKLLDFNTIAILIPVIASAFGLFLMGVESMIFAQFKSLPENMRLYTSIVSAILLAFGGEIGSVSNNVAMFQRYIKSRMQARAEWDIVTRWEWVGFVVSWIATTLSMFIASSTRPSVTTSWRGFFSEWLIVPLMILAVGDVIFGIVELGVHTGTFDLRMLEWIERRRAEQRKIDYLNSLQINDNKEGSLKTEEESTVHCWCGKQLKSKRSYNAHLRAHKNEARQFSNPKQAHDELQTRYQDTIENADFEFPKLRDFVKWLTTK